MKEGLITTGEVRLYAARLFEPNHRNGKYSVVAMIPQSDQDTLVHVLSALEDAEKDGILNTLLMDGNALASIFHGYYTLRASSSYKPEVVDDCCRLITNEATVYSGCYGRVCFELHPYYGEKNGVAARLISVQITRQGEHLKGQRASDVFGKWNQS